MKKEITITLKPALSPAGEFNYRLIRLTNDISVGGRYSDKNYRVGDVIPEAVVKLYAREQGYKVIIQDRE